MKSNITERQVETTPTKDNRISTVLAAGWELRRFETVEEAFLFDLLCQLAGCTTKCGVALNTGMFLVFYKDTP